MLCMYKMYIYTIQSKSSSQAKCGTTVRPVSGEENETAITTTSQKLLYRPDANFGILVL